MVKSNTVTSNKTKSNHAHSAPTVIPPAQTSLSHVSQPGLSKVNRRVRSRKTVTSLVSERTLPTDIIKPLPTISIK